MIGWIEQWNVGHLIDLSQIQVECAGKAIAFSCNLFDCRFRRVHWMLSTFDVQVQIAARHLPDKVLIRKCSKCRDFFFSLSLFFPPRFNVSTPRRTWDFLWTSLFLHMVNCGWSFRRVWLQKNLFDTSQERISVFMAGVSSLLTLTLSARIDSNCFIYFFFLKRIFGGCNQCFNTFLFDFLICS